MRFRPTRLEEPADYGENDEPVEEAEEAEIGTDQDPESDSDEEEIVEPVAEGQRWRYPLRERRTPRRFPDAEDVLLTDEGARKLRRSEGRHPQSEMVECHAGRDGFRKERGCI